MKRALASATLALALGASGCLYHFRGGNFPEYIRTLAVDPVIARPVAIKVIKESELLTPPEVEQFQERFRHEAEAAGRLSHPDIVRIYDIGPNFMVMEFIEGRTLAEVMRQGTRLSMRQASAIVR